MELYLVCSNIVSIIEIVKSRLDQRERETGASFKNIYFWCWHHQCIWNPILAQLFIAQVNNDNILLTLFHAIFHQELCRGKERKSHQKLVPTRRVCCALFVVLNSNPLFNWRIIELQCTEVKNIHVSFRWSKYLYQNNMKLTSVY